MYYFCEACCETLREDSFDKTICSIKKAPKYLCVGGYIDMPICIKCQKENEGNVNKYELSDSMYHFCEACCETLKEDRFDKTICSIKKVPKYLCIGDYIDKPVCKKCQNLLSYPSQ
jgi:hypothetical protein